MKTNPLVSIIIPVYNGANFLKDAIESALKQTYKNVEILVINDGSKDHGATDKIAKSYGRKIRFFSKKNGGVASALNFGIKKMQGDYFAWLSHDDLYLPQKIAAQVKCLDGNPKTILYSDFELVGPGIEHLSNARLKYPKNDFVYSLIVNRFIHGCTVLIPKNAFKEVGTFDETLQNTQDLDLWFRFLAHGYSFKHIAEILVKSRVHPGQGSNQRRSQQLIEEDALYLRVLQKFPQIEVFVDSNLSRYFELSLWFKKMGLKKASSYCRQLGLQRMSIRKNISLLSWTYFWTEELTRTYWENVALRIMKKIGLRK